MIDEKNMINILINRDQRGEGKPPRFPPPCPTAPQPPNSPFPIKRFRFLLFFENFTNHLYSFLTISELLPPPPAPLAPPLTSHTTTWKIGSLVLKSAARARNLGLWGTDIGLLCACGEGGAAVDAVEDAGASALGHDMRNAEGVV